jgi:hypothetical protein
MRQTAAQVVAHYPCRVVRYHLRRAQRVKVVPFIVSPYQRDALRIQGADRVNRTHLRQHMLRLTTLPTGWQTSLATEVVPLFCSANSTAIN